MFKTADCFFFRGPVLSFQHLQQQLTTVYNCGSLKYEALFFSVLTHMQAKYSSSENKMENESPDLSELRISVQM